MKISKLQLFVLVISILYVLVLGFKNYKTYIDTKDQPAVDGVAVYGYPFTYYSYGGYCITTTGEEGLCVDEGNGYTNLLLDLAIILGLPLLVNLLVLKFSKKK